MSGVLIYCDIMHHKQLNKSRLDSELFFATDPIIFSIVIHLVITSKETRAFRI